VNLKDRNSFIEKLGPIGKSGRLPLPNATNDANIGEIQKVVGILAETVKALLDHVTQQPNCAKDGFRFLIDSRVGSATYNILNVAGRARNGLPNNPGYAVFNHGLGYCLNRYEMMSWALGTPSAGQPTTVGGLLIVSYTNNRTVFQLDADAEGQEAVAVVTCYSSHLVPTPGAPFDNKGVISPTATFDAADTTIDGP